MFKQTFHKAINLTSLPESSEAYGSTKLTVSLEGKVEGVGGRGCIYWLGVFGGSILGTTFFHASTNAESPDEESVTSVENGRRVVTAAAAPVVVGRVRKREAT